MFFLGYLSVVPRTGLYVFLFVRPLGLEIICVGVFVERHHHQKSSSMETPDATSSFILVSATLVLRFTWNVTRS